MQELGRSVTNGQLLDYRSDISDLLEQHPTLAKQFDSLRQELDSPFPSIESLSHSSIDKQLLIQVAIRRKNKVAKDLDDILQLIRQEQGFESFLHAETEEYFLAAAQEGPIVVLNSTELRTDAILVTKEQVTSIPLQLSHASVVKYLGTDLHGGETDLHDNKDKREILRWLWKTTIQPVLQELGFYPKPVDPLPWIWWIGVGLMARAPIHAATNFKFTQGTIQADMTTVQYCLPSYTSTIRALQYSRSRQQSHQNVSTLIVTMPTTPGETSLKGVSKGADEIQHTLRDFSTVTTLQRPTAGCVLKSLSGYSLAHFACHGVSEINPADSHLLLLKRAISDDGFCTEAVDKLCVKDVAMLKLPAARLAYLRLQYSEQYFIKSCG